MAIGSDLAAVPGLTRIENTSQEQVAQMTGELVRESYPHEEIFGRFITVHDFIDCPVEEAYAYLADATNFDEWTFSIRGLTPSAGDRDLLAGREAMVPDTTMYVRVKADPHAHLVDYHCAWDQSDELWMVYLMRLVDAEGPLGRRGTVLLWTNCRHPYFTTNPRPDLAPSTPRPWVGDLWDMFSAGHGIELANIKAILEHRHAASRVAG